MNSRSKPASVHCDRIQVGARRATRLAVVASFTLLASCHAGKGLRWAESRAPAIRVNQLGYLPNAPKWATLKSESTEGTRVELRDASGDVVYQTDSIPRGLDAASGDRVHWVDFSEFSAPGEGYVLVTAKDRSFPFTIAADLYADAKVDALKYFYHNRSGVPITEPYVERTHSRPAGHLSDEKVPCWIQEQCTYTLDVRGGWYDAGDHGKYVVNGGISAWTLLALYERLAWVNAEGTWGDGTLNIPESHNGVPDLLDEARFEVEFLMRMQVPEGHALAGMVHHKIHDNAWTPLAIEPAPQTDQRALHPPSTAATLNMAAVAAQAARIYRPYDPAFAAYCLNAARRAHRAAKDHPDKLAPAQDKNGGGPYDDRHLSDEFFWAAAELYITTREPRYLEELKASPHFSSFPTTLSNPDGGQDGDGVTAAFTWQSTAGLGWISLALASTALDEQDREHIVNGIVAAADDYFEATRQEGYRLPMNLGESEKYPWGSNSFVLNNMLVSSVAYDLKRQPRHAETVVLGMDYIFGRNPMVQSYVTGYGEVPLEHPHHRFWAHSLDPSFPRPPAGAVSGGPNSTLQDPQTKRSGLSTSLPPQKCFVDHIDAWSVNEVSINWNAPLAWTLTFLDEYGRTRPQRPPH